MIRPEDFAGPNAVNACVGRNIVSAMAARAMTVEALATRIGVTPAKLRECLMGRGRLSAAATIEVAISLGVTVGELFNDSEFTANHVIH
jgi:DNA-binding transcriptional regulator YdaS (Cro superfamily)